MSIITSFRLGTYLFSVTEVEYYIIKFAYYYGTALLFIYYQDVLRFPARHLRPPSDYHVHRMSPSTLRRPIISHGFSSAYTFEPFCVHLTHPNHTSLPWTSSSTHQALLLLPNHVLPWACHCTFDGHPFDQDVILLRRGPWFFQTSHLICWDKLYCVLAHTMAYHYDSHTPISAQSCPDV